MPYVDTQDLDLVAGALLQADFKVCTVSALHPPQYPKMLYILF